MSTPTSMQTEHVLCVPTLLFHELGYFQGFQSQVDRYLKVLLDPLHTSYRPRSEVEDDPSYKQLIPYCLFRCRGQLFVYTRGKSGGEGRLHAKRSIGVGGHISSTDPFDADRQYLPAMHREIAEEVDLQSAAGDRCVGLINDDSTAVGQVHLGIVHLFELESAQVLPRETSILEAGFSSPAELLQQRERLETWSQICLDELLRSEWPAIATRTV
jgi:predicted NUDIX family phosphoesterase